MKPVDVLQVKRAFDLEQLKKRCLATVDELFDEPNGELYGIEKTSQTYWFRDNGSNILCVAHCDVVCDEDKFGVISNYGGEKVILSPRLDDRLGVYTVLDLLPKLGIKIDILLTDDEESMASTAAIFNPPRQYNWVVEFDRRGESTVHYQYTNMIGKLSPYFPNVQHGSYTDIVELNFLKCGCFNVGVGYHDEHTEMCYMILNEFYRQIARFIRFYDDNYKKPFPWAGSKVSYVSGGYRGALPSYYEQYYDDYYSKGGNKRRPFRGSAYRQDNAFDRSYESQFHETGEIDNDLPDGYSEAFPAEAPAYGRYGELICPECCETLDADPRFCYNCGWDLDKIEEDRQRYREMYPETTLIPDELETGTASSREFYD